MLLESAKSLIINITEKCACTADDVIVDEKNSEMIVNKKPKKEDELKEGVAGKVIGSVSQHLPSKRALATMTGIGAGLGTGAAEIHNYRKEKIWANQASDNVDSAEKETRYKETIDKLKKSHPVIGSIADNRITKFITDKKTDNDKTWQAMRSAAKEKSDYAKSRRPSSLIMNGISNAKTKISNIDDKIKDKFYTPSKADSEDFLKKVKQRLEPKKD